MSSDENDDSKSAPSTAGASLLDLKKKYLGNAARSEFTLFIFFSPTDCPACLSEASIWQRLHADGQRLSLQVVGVMNHPNKLEGEQFLKNLGITFPVLFDNTSVLKNKYMIGETPEKVLIDSEGETLLITPGGKTEEQRRAFEESVLKLVAGKNLQ
jgi:peroxiredoxin